MNGTPNPLALAREVYEAYAEADLVPLFEMLDENVVWRSHSHPSSPFHGVHHGIEAIQAYFAKLSTVDIQRFDLKTLVESGDKVIALLDIRRVAVDTGQVFEGQFVHVMRLKNGRIIEFDIYEASADIP